MIGTDDLYLDRQSLVAKASRHCECRTTRHSDGKHAFHPFVVGSIFLPAISCCDKLKSLLYQNSETLTHLALRPSGQLMITI